MAIYITIELLVSLSRIPYIYKTTGLSIKKYISHVLLPLLPLTILACASSEICILLFQAKYRFLITGTFSVLVSTITSWYCVLNSTERAYFTDKILKRMVRKG